MKTWRQKFLELLALRPAWRLVNSVMHATEKQLEVSIESCERWSWQFTKLLIIGLVFEFALAAFHPKRDSFWDIWGSSICDLMVVLGVGGEVQFGRMVSTRQGELQRRSKRELSEAKDREARLWAVLQPRHLTMASRNGDDERRKRKLTELKKFAGTTALIQSIPDLEAQKLAGGIHGLLSTWPAHFCAGWKAQFVSGVPLGHIDEGVTLFTLEIPDIGKEGEIIMSDSFVPSEAGKAAQALVAFLKLDLGPPFGPRHAVKWYPIYKGLSETMIGGISLPDGCVLILIGDKPIKTAFMWRYFPDNQRE